jgi:hypothetical protein
VTGDGQEVSLSGISRSAISRRNQGASQHFLANWPTDQPVN